MARTIEAEAEEVCQRHNLTGLHLFKQGDDWRIFGFRTHPKGFQASVEQGGGKTISASLENLDARLAAGPIMARDL